MPTCLFMSATTRGVGHTRCVKTTSHLTDFKDKVRMCLQMTLLPLLVSSQPAEYSGMGLSPPRWTPAVPTWQVWQYESGMPASPMI